MGGQPQIDLLAISEHFVTKEKKLGSQATAGLGVLQQLRSGVQREELDSL